MRSDFSGFDAEAAEEHNSVTNLYIHPKGDAFERSAILWFECSIAAG
jgi:hypothetical protein